MAQNENGEKKPSSVISLMDNPSMPALWDSTDEGLTFEWGDYLCILQTAPRGLLEVGAQMGIVSKEMGAAARKRVKEMQFKYWYALFCYWKKGRNPDGFNSARPARVYTVESSLFAPNPMLCCFMPSGRWNGGAMQMEPTRQNILIAFFNHLTDGHADEVKRLGTMAVGYEMQTGKKLPNRKSGCLSMLLLTLSIPTFLVILLFAGVFLR